ncbi:uncharacterized protein LOC120329438 [Styela clava]
MAKSCKDIVKEGPTPAGVSGPPPSKRFRDTAIVNPCSGRYEGGERGLAVQLLVDVDKTRKYYEELNIISGTVSTKNAKDAPWSVDASAVYFTIIPRTLNVSGGTSNNRDATASIKATFSDGTKAGGSLAVKLTKAKNWSAKIDLEIDGQSKLSLNGIERQSLFFKDIKIDIDYTDKMVWPIVELFNLGAPPAGMSDRKIDAFSAFEDAGLKLHYNEADSEKVEDPTPNNPWSKSDLFDVMMHYFDETEQSDDNIWCMMGTTPPDKRYMGFSFDKDGRHGFGLFTGHSSFSDLDSDNIVLKNEAQRRLLHYLVHECGHCLGLKHPFEIGAPNSLSWMNYAWKYDVSHQPGSFYSDFRFSFSDQELRLLRHSPGKEFRTACSQTILADVMGSGYKVKSEAPDVTVANDNDDINEESDVVDDPGVLASKRPKRKIVLDLRIRSEPFVKGQLLSFEARIKNVGKLPALIEGDLSLESGNLQLYLTSPTGVVQVIDPFVRPIQSGYTKPLVLYTPEDEEGHDRYNELVIVGEGPDGYQATTPGRYELRAVYNGGRYKVTSATYPLHIVENTDEDDETSNQILSAATLQTSSWGRFKKAHEYWKKVVSKPVEYKKKRVTELLCVMEGLCKENARTLSSGGKKTRSASRKTTLASSKPVIGSKQLLKDTADLVKHYHEEGKKSENLDYGKLVFGRCKLFLHDKRIQDAEMEFNQMLTDLVTRGVKYDVVRKLAKDWSKMKNPTDPEDKKAAGYLQKKVETVLTWAPTTDGDGESDLSGIGLGMPFSNFDVPQLRMASTIVEMLFNKYSETKSLLATITYADKLQKGREVNYMVLRWALEAFIVHSMDAKRAGIKYPEPRDKDKSVQTDAAMIVTRRDGQPNEDWMNYWRCDADFNYHHRHFHIVYIVSQFLRRDAQGKLAIMGSAPKHLLRQGELFGYMHTQLLGRYDAERESWGLEPVVPWSYDEVAMTFNAGLEFHNDRQFRWYAPRPNSQWPENTRKKFRWMEGAYRQALSTGEVARGVEMTPNWSGHILEPSSGIYQDQFGSFHNSGHGVFGSTGLNPRATSYMNDTATAVRDPIFYRWHKKIDNLWHDNNEYYRSELGHDGPPVTITADDMIITIDEKFPQGFDQMKGGKWVANPSQEKSCLKTFLGPPTKKYEWDNKLSHEKFYYHLRLRRNNGPGSRDGDINLTIRIFICPKKRQTERRRWIEMDKFVCSLKAGQDNMAFTREDVHSSVIKRLPQNMKDDFERPFVKDAGGFCECGWPYTMLLPRGKKTGEDYVLCVIATDNDIDSIGVRTTCGSMSYCGARGEEYPDKRIMGYPFSTPITYKGEKLPIPEVFDSVSNAAYKNFMIENNVSEPPPVSAGDIWWPHLQLGINDGTLRKEPPKGVSEFVQSDLVGTFRVMIDNDVCWPASGNLLIRFHGRGGGGGAYLIRDITLALRDGNTLNVVQGQSAKVTYKGQEAFSVPQEGLISDLVNLQFQPARGDYFITFTLESPGVYLPASQNSQTSTYFIGNKSGTGYEEIPEDWSMLGERITGRFAHIQCVSAIMTKI